MIEIGPKDLAKAEGLLALYNEYKLILSEINAGGSITITGKPQGTYQGHKLTMNLDADDAHYLRQLFIGRIEKIKDDLARISVFVK